MAYAIETEKAQPSLTHRTLTESNSHESDVNPLWGDSPVCAARTHSRCSSGGDLRLFSVRRASHRSSSRFAARQQTFTANIEHSVATRRISLW